MSRSCSYSAILVIYIYILTIDSAILRSFFIKRQYILSQKNNYVLTNVYWIIILSSCFFCIKDYRQIVNKKNNKKIAYPWDKKIFRMYCIQYLSFTGTLPKGNVRIILETTFFFLCRLYNIQSRLSIL